MTIILLTLMACEFSASTDVRGPDTSAYDGTDSGDDTGGGGGEEGGGDEGGGDEGGGDEGGDDGVDPNTTDDDGDGYSEDDGDCDDTDKSVHPEAVDDCDGKDGDCDGEVDEDAQADEEYEPNDSTPYDLGSLETKPDHIIQAYLHNDDDVDRYGFELVDSSWGSFSLKVSLSSIPDGGTYTLEVVNRTSGEVRFSDASDRTITTQIDDVPFSEDAGDWEVIVGSQSGADCGNRYLLSIEFDD